MTIKTFTNIPRFYDKATGAPYENILQCTKCFWAIVDDRVTRYWRKCRLCGSNLERVRSYYSGYYKRHPEDM